jgi:peptide deformylase
MPGAFCSRLHVVESLEIKLSVKSGKEALEPASGADNVFMPIQTLLQLGDPRLREKSLPVEDPSAPQVVSLIRDLTDTLAHWRAATGYGRGIAAPQLAVLRRVIFLKLPGVEPWALINPEIIERSREKVIVWDACLSFLSIFMHVERHREITVRYRNVRGEMLECRAGDDRNLSELLQHEIDHLDGILAVDRMTDIKTLCTREEFEKRHRHASPYAKAASSTNV